MIVAIYIQVVIGESHKYMSYGDAPEIVLIVMLVGILLLSIRYNTYEKLVKINRLTLFS